MEIPTAYIGNDYVTSFMSPWQHPLVTAILQDMRQSGLDVSETPQAEVDAYVANYLKSIHSSCTGCSYLQTGSEEILVKTGSPSSSNNQQLRRKKPKRSLRDIIREQNKQKFAVISETTELGDEENTSVSQQAKTKQKQKTKKTKNQGKSKTFKRQSKRPGRV